MDVLVWHGASRMTNPEELKKHDVILTTYAVLESCFRKQQTGFKRKGAIIKEKSPLHVVAWERVIVCENVDLPPCFSLICLPQLDEAHNIKERATNTAKATFELKAKYRWCLSGTPLQNRVGELYSLIRFLGCDPFSHYYCKPRFPFVRPVAPFEANGPQVRNVNVSPYIGSSAIRGHVTVCTRSL